MYARRTAALHSIDHSMLITAECCAIAQITRRLSSIGVDGNALFLRILSKTSTTENTNINTRSNKLILIIKSKLIHLMNRNTSHCAQNNTSEGGNQLVAFCEEKRARKTADACPPFSRNPHWTTATTNRAREKKNLIGSTEYLMNYERTRISRLNI